MELTVVAVIAYSRVGPILIRTVLSHRSARSWIIWNALSSPCLATRRSMSASVMSFGLVNDSNSRGVPLAGPLLLIGGVVGTGIVMVPVVGAWPLAAAPVVE